MQVRKPFEAKKKVFFFPAVERMGQKAVSIKNLTHGYGDHRLFDETSLEIERGERVALIGAPCRPFPSGLISPLASGCHARQPTFPCTQ